MIVKGELRDIIKRRFARFIDIIAFMIITTGGLFAFIIIAWLADLSCQRLNFNIHNLIEICILFVFGAWAFANLCNIILDHDVAEYTKGDEGDTE